jgi:hypothetical protein
MKNQQGIALRLLAGNEGADANRPAKAMANQTCRQSNKPELWMMSKENETPEQREKRTLDEELDRQLEQTFRRVIRPKSRALHASECRPRTTGKEKTAKPSAALSLCRTRRSGNAQ